MTSFNIKGVPTETMIKIIDASFPNLSYKLIADEIIFGQTTKENVKKIEELIITCRFAARFSNSKPVFVPEVSFDVKDYLFAPSIDVNRELENRGELVWAGDGLATISGEFLKLKKNLENYWANVAADLNAVEFENSALWGIDLTNQSKYMNDFPHEAALVIGCKKSSDSVAKINSIFTAGLHSDVAHLGNAISDLRVLGVCQPSVCTSCYHALAAQRKSSNGLYTTYNRVFRNEGKRSMERLLSFSVRDLIAVGEEEFVRQSREVFISRAQRFIADLGLPIAIEPATDPFFSAAADKLVVQQSAGLKHELLIEIPQTGNRLAIGSVNLHLNVFGNRFDICRGEEKAFSCCMGIGFERTAYAFASYYGVENKNWPQIVKNVFERRS